MRGPPWWQHPPPPPEAVPPASVGILWLLPGLGSGVRRRLQATQPRTSGSKHLAWTHGVGASPSPSLRLLAPGLMLLMPTHTQLGLSRLGCPRGRKQRRHHPLHSLRPPACWGGTTLSHGPRALHPRPSLSTCGFSIQPLNLHPAGRALCWALRPGSALGQQVPPPAGLLCPTPQGQPISPGDPHQPSPPTLTCRLLWGALLPFSELVQFTKHILSAHTGCVCPEGPPHWGW